MSTNESRLISTTETPTCNISRADVIVLKDTQYVFHRPIMTRQSRGGLSEPDFDSHRCWLCTLAASPDLSLGVRVNSMRGGLRMGVLPCANFVRNRAKRRVRTRRESAQPTPVGESKSLYKFFRPASDESRGFLSCRLWLGPGGATLRASIDLHA